jgi:hypothetical protein
VKPSSSARFTTFHASAAVGRAIPNSMPRLRPIS